MLSYHSQNYTNIQKSIQTSLYCFYNFLFVTLHDFKNELLLHHTVLGFDETQHTSWLESHNTNSQIIIRQIEPVV